MRCRGLQRLANTPYLRGFHFSALPPVAPYCVRGGIRVVSNVPIRALFSVACVSVFLAKQTSARWSCKPKKPSRSGLPVRSPRGRERNRLQRRRAHALVPPLDDRHLGPADEQAAAGRHYLAPGDELLAVCGRQEVHLVLDREHLAVGWRERHRRVPAGGVGYGACDGPVEVALLLGDPLGERHLDDARALAHLDDLRSKQPHQALAGEARLHPLTGVVPAGRLGRLARVLAHPSPFWWFR